MTNTYPRSRPMRPRNRVVLEELEPLHCPVVVGRRPRGEHRDDDRSHHRGQKRRDAPIRYSGLQSGSGIRRDPLVAGIRSCSCASATVLTSHRGHGCGLAGEAFLGLSVRLLGGARLGLNGPLAAGQPALPRRGPTRDARDDGLRPGQGVPHVAEELRKRSRESVGQDPSDTIGDREHPLG